MMMLICNFWLRFLIAITHACTMGAGGARRPSTVVLGLVALVTLSLWANHQRIAARVHRLQPSPDLGLFFWTPL